MSQRQQAASPGAAIPDAAGARLLGRLAEQIAGLAQLVRDLDDHRDRLRHHGDQAALAALPSGDQLAPALLSLRKATRAGQP